MSYENHYISFTSKYTPNVDWHNANMAALAASLNGLPGFSATLNTSYSPYRVDFDFRNIRKAQFAPYSSSSSGLVVRTYTSGDALSSTVIGGFNNSDAKYNVLDGGNMRVRIGMHSVVIEFSSTGGYEPCFAYVFQENQYALSLFRRINSGDAYALFRAYDKKESGSTQLTAANLNMRQTSNSFPPILWFQQFELLKPDIRFCASTYRFPISSILTAQNVELFVFYVSNFSVLFEV